MAWSPLLVAALALAAGGGALVWLAGDVAGGLGYALSEGLAQAGALEPDRLGELGLTLVARAAGPALLVVAVIFIAALGAALVQVGPLFTLRPLRPDWGRLSLVGGWRRLWSAEARLARWRALLAAAAVLVPAGLILLGELRQIATLPYAEPAAGGLALQTLLERWLVASVVGLLVLGVLDWAMQRRLLAAELRMSRREVEEERTETEGRAEYREERARRGWEIGERGG